MRWDLWLRLDGRVGFGDAFSESVGRDSGTGELRALEFRCHAISSTSDMEEVLDSFGYKFDIQSIFGTWLVSPQGVFV